jgi:CheY-like chemotaxis protein
MAKVLVIEDDPDMREVARVALACGGYEVVTASNGREGLRALEGAVEQNPCVIILDLMMPVMDGLTFLIERKRRAVAPDVPVLCVSAAGPEVIGQAIRLGAAGCMNKPADLDELCRRVNDYCVA